MITNMVLTGDKVYLRQINLNDCTERYASWLNDFSVNQYLETKWSIQNIDTITSFVKAQRESKDSILFAIIYKENDHHIGNIKIGPIHPHYKHADISYFIGEKKYWNNGIATEAIRLVCDFGFNQLKLHRIEAGAYDCAIGSWKALEKCGFIREACLKEQVYFEGKYIDVFRYGLIDRDYII